jgi:hypothetical protein
MKILMPIRFIYMLLFLVFISITSCNKDKCASCEFFVVDTRGNNILQITKSTFNTYYPNVNWCSALDTYEGYEFKSGEVVIGKLKKSCR